MKKFNLGDFVVSNDLKSTVVYRIRKIEGLGTGHLATLQYLSGKVICEGGVINTDYLSKPSVEQLENSLRSLMNALAVKG